MTGVRTRSLLPVTLMPSHRPSDRRLAAPCPIATRRCTGRLLGLSLSVLAFSLAATARPDRLAADDGSGLATAVESIAASDLERMVSVLADDTFEGREAGSRGGNAAAGYLMRRFASLKLKPAGAGGTYWQPFGAGYRNILSVLPGSDPELRDEYILIGAHYDHVGYGNRRNSYGPFGYIHNGADDNASGSATVLEIAEAFSKLPTPPRRSVIFALWDAEEKGLLGSKHWLQYPTIDRSKICFAINLDMVGRLRNERVEVYGSRTAAGLRRFLSEANDTNPLRLDFIFKMKADSDHYPFFTWKIPVVMFHTGLHEQYHRPSDDVERINFRGAQRVARYVFHVALDASDGLDFEFRSAASGENEQTRAALNAASTKAPLRLGIWWRADGREQHPLVINHVVPDSPAARAGLQVGDRLLAFGKTPVNEERAFQQAVRSSSNATTITVERPGRETPLVLPVTLAGDSGRLGIRLRSDPAEPSTAIISFVAPGSPAQAAKLQIGDRIYALDGEPFQSVTELRRRLASQSAPWKLQIERAGRIELFTVGKSPSPSE